MICSVGACAKNHPSDAGRCFFFAARYVWVSSNDREWAEDGRCRKVGEGIASLAKKKVVR